jgi:DNA-binding transcriptional ArsR family regulator
MAQQIGVTLADQPLPRQLAQPQLADAETGHSTERLTDSGRGGIFNHMVDNSPAELDALFRALSDQTRRAMLQSLAVGARSVGELAAPHAMSLAAASKHIQMLERAGLVQREIQGRTHLCRLDPRPLHGGAEWIRHYEGFWNHRLDLLDAILREETPAGIATAPAKKRKRP